MGIILNEGKSAVIGLLGQEGTVAYGKAAGTGGLVAGKNSSEARSEKRGKANLKRLFGKAQSCVKAMAYPLYWACPSSCTSLCSCVCTLQGCSSDL